MRNISMLMLVFVGCALPVDSKPSPNEPTGTATQAVTYATTHNGFAIDMNGGGTIATFNTILANAKAAMPSGKILTGCVESWKQVGTTANEPVLMCASLDDSTTGADFAWVTADVTGLSVVDINTASGALSVPSGYRMRWPPHMHFAGNGTKAFLVGAADNSTADSSTLSP